MKALLRLFLSMRTAFWMFGIFVCILFIGSLSLPDNLAFFSGIDDTPLFQWLTQAGVFKITWWIYALILMLSLLAVSTILCTFDALLNRFGRKQFLQKLSPQVMHIGVLFIMLGHLLTASMGLKMDVLMKKGETKTVTGLVNVTLLDAEAWKDPNGYDQDWSATLLWSDQTSVQQETTIRPAHPRYFENYGIYIKSVNPGPEPSALLRVCRDPGAAWGLLGGALLSIGGMGFLYTRAGRSTEPL